MNVVAVVGIGSVGLRLAPALGKITLTIGHDLSLPKLNGCRQWAAHQQRLRFQTE